MSSGSNRPLSSPRGRIAGIKMGTTVATNALLERRGDPTVWVTTSGFGDMLRIGYQQRPDLFALNIVLPEPVHDRVIEVAERVMADGTIDVPLDEDGAERELEAAFEAGYGSVAITFMHGYRYPDHERRIARIARRLGFSQVSVSHEVSPLIKFISRGDTTVVDAYLSPILRRYVDTVAADVLTDGSGMRLMFMQSNGGLTDSSMFQGKDSILSGPAGGVVGAARTSRMAGLDKIIAFDMGGTSTDVSHFAGEFERSLETEVAGVRMRAPMLYIHTVAAGGGSILHFDGARYRVGPDSAGADPGPACYRRGGPLTITDCNVMLGRIVPRFFPGVFGSGQDKPLDDRVVAEKFTILASEITAATGDRRSPKRWRKDSSPSPSRTWRMRSRRFLCNGDTTFPNMRCAASAAPEDSTPAASPTRSACEPCSSTRTPASCPLTAWVSPISWRCASDPSRRVSTRRTMESLTGVIAALEGGSRRRVAGADRDGGGGDRRAPGPDPLRRYGLGADRGLWRRNRDDDRVRGASSPALWVRHADKSLILEAAVVEALGGARRYRGPTDRPGRGGSNRRVRAEDCRNIGVHGRRTPHRARHRPRRHASGATSWKVRQSSSSRMAPTWSRTAGRPPDEPESPHAGPGDAGRGVGPPADGGGSGHARGIQQPVHVDRGADGSRADQHGLFGQHQGAPRLLVRLVRFRGPTGRQRSAPARCIWDR